ncbi:MAG: Na+/H+ antiporter [Sandaracinaceae bacterium]|nr:Na+/H+ antiporter [Sandaracinaceae bacterium]
MSEVGPILACLVVSAMCAGIVRRLPLPLPLLQVAAGVLMAAPLGMELTLEPHTFLLLLIPPLLFIDGWRLPKSDFRRDRTTILLMAFGLVVMTVLGVGWLIAWVVPAIPLPVAFAIAAALSPTDVVAVTGISGRTMIPARLMTLLRGEALFNDASGLVSMRIAVAALLSGTFSFGDAASSFALVSLGGIAIGVVGTWLFGKLLWLVLERGDDANAGPRILLIVLFPYVLYMVAEHFALSGILAAASAGMMASRTQLVEARHRATRLQGTAVLDMIELSLTGLVFVLLGLQLPNILDSAPAIARQAALSLPGLAGTVGLVVLALMAIRAVWIWLSFSVTLYRARTPGRAHRGPPLRLVLAAAIAGVRGTVTLAAALSLPLTLADGSEFPARDVAIFFATSVIVTWLLAASVALPRLFRAVVLPGDPGVDPRIEAQRMLAGAAIVAIERHLATTGRGPAGASADAEDLVLASYRARLSADVLPFDETLAHERALRLVGIAAERVRLAELVAARRVDEASHRAILHELDIAEGALVAADRDGGAKA